MESATLERPQAQTMDINTLLKNVVAHGASDLHLVSRSEPQIRIDGKLVPLNLATLDGTSIEEMCYTLITDKQKKHLEEHKEVDFAFALPNVGRFRGNYYYTIGNELAAAFRIIPTEIPTLDDLGSPAIFKEIVKREKGLILVTGPTGSGKSTTLAAMIDYKNENQHEHILTIEDPIEFVHISKKSLVNQREVHRDTQSFEASLRSALREDPDTILVGEMRDLETIRLALTAAETGHLVFGTLHTTSAPKTIDRIVDVFPAEEKDMVRSMISSSLQAVISQTLLKRVQGGRVAAHEILIGTNAVRSMIKENKLAQMRSALQTGAADGMQTMDQSLQKLMTLGYISRDTAMKKADNPKALMERA